MRVIGRIRPSANVSIGATSPAPGLSSYPLNNNAEFRKAVRTLKPRFIRLDAVSLSDLSDSSRPAFNFFNLRTAVNQTRAIGAEPLIALRNPPEWGLTGPGYLAFVVQTAQAVNPSGAKPVRYFELIPGATTTDDATAVALYNQAYAALKRLSGDFRVGGIGASSGRLSTLAALLKEATGLDFLSLQHFGTMSGEPPAAALFTAAREVANLRGAARALDGSRWKNAPIYVTQSNLNAARNIGGHTPSDGRMGQMMSAAWWATFMGNASHVVDQVFHNDAVNPEWGLLDEIARAYPAYYALWLWNTYLPPGSERVRVGVSSPDIVAAAVNTPTAHNLLLVNTTGSTASVQIAIRGFPVLRTARLQVYDDPQQVVRTEALPKSPFQTIRLKPHAVAVVQFIEPPKQ